MDRIASPRTDDESVESEIQRKGKTAARITPADIEAAIVEAVYIRPGDYLRPGHPASLLTICVLVMRNGFTVTGENACASPENFDAEIGARIARENAKQKVWPLLGFLLKEQLHAEAVRAVALPGLAPHQQRVVVEADELAKKLAALDAFLTSAVFAGLPLEEQHRLTSQASYMESYERVLRARIDAF